MRLAPIAFIAALAASPALFAQAPLYKLVDKSGRVTYVDKVPRGFDGEVTPIVIDPATNAARKIASEASDMACHTSARMWFGNAIGSLEASPVSRPPRLRGVAVPG